MKIKKKDAPMYMGGGKMQKMKKKGAPQLAMSKDTRNEDQKALGVKNPSRAITKKEKDRRDSYRRDRYIKKPLSVMEKGGKMSMYMYGGKVYAEGGKMLEQMAKNPKMIAQMKAIVGKAK